MSRILIAGCGRLGSAVGVALAAEGHEVWGLRRNPAGLVPGIRPLAGDLSEPDGLPELPEGLERVLYAAAAGESSERAYRAAYADGMRHLLDALAGAEQPVTRLVFVSSTAVYGQTDGSWVDEASPTEPGHFSGSILLEAERTALGGPFPAVALRLGGIYGPSRTWLVRGIREGRATRGAGPPAYTNRIHEEDAARAAAHLLALPEPEPVYLGVDSEPADRDEVLCWLARRLGVSDPPVAAQQAAGRARRSNKRCRNARLLASGFTFLYPTYREGYAQVLDG